MSVESACLSPLFSTFFTEKRYSFQKQAKDFFEGHDVLTEAYDEG
jgi:hypothetical protein